MPFFHCPLRPYKNISLLFFGIIFAIILSKIESFHLFLLHLNNWGYFGVFIAGVLFSSSLTVGTSVLILITLAELFPPFLIGLIAGGGAVLGDLVIFHFVRNNLAQEISILYHRIDKKSSLKLLLYSKYFKWILPVFGAIIIASPFPDELGVSLMGLSKMGTTRFAILVYILNSIGIFIFLSISVFLK